MKQSLFTIQSNEPLTADINRMVLRGDTSAITCPGQFADVMLESLYLRRPISVCDLQGDLLTLVFRQVGKGTRAMAGLEPGTRLDLLTGLGNGYDLSRAGDRPLLIGGGVGIPPLLLLARRLREQGKEVTVAAGFNTAEDAILLDEFRQLGCRVLSATADGSLGTKGFATDVMPDEFSFFYACGPIPMLKAVYKKTRADGQFSLEERMGCGFGACMGCTVATVNGPKRVCRDGPVFFREEMPWND